MQDSIAVAAILAYAAAVIWAWRVLPGGAALKFQRTAIFPGAFLTLTFFGAWLIPALRGALMRHLWVSYRGGYGQSVISVLGGFAVLIAVAGFIFWQIHDVAHGGRYPGGAFSGYAAGIGLLAVQVILVRRMERDPALRGQIEGQ